MLRLFSETPGYALLFAAGLVARLPAAIVTVLLILRVRETGGTYADGGIVVASYSVASGVAAPALSRVIDRVGQTKVLIATVPLYVAALLTTAVLPAIPVGAFCVLAAVIGALYPQVGGMTRALTATIFPDPARRHTAFALESGAVEALFIVAPAVFVGGIATHFGAATAIGVAAVTSVGGAIVFGLSPHSRAWVPAPKPASGRPDALATRPYLFIIAVFVSVGLVLGGTEVALTAFSEAHGHREAVGYLLALSAFGSLLGGVAAVRVGASARPIRRMVVLLAALAATVCFLGVPGGFVSMGPAVVLSGLSVAPTLSNVYGLMPALVPGSRMTEGFAWVAAALMGGASVGVVLSGFIATHASPSTAFAVVATPVALAAVATWSARDWLATATAA
jgi:MFS family permease